MKVFKAVGNAVSSVVKGVVNAVKSVVNAVGKVVSSVINFVASPFMGIFGAPTAADNATETQRQQGVLIQQQGSNINIPVVYGYRKVAGTVVFAETGSTNNQYLWVAYVFSEGPVEGVREMFIDDNQLPASVVGDVNAGKIVDITDKNSKYAGRVRLQGFPGVFFGTPSSSTVASTSILKEAPSWKNSMHYNGMAVIFARYEWKQVVTQADADNNPFQGNIPSLTVSLLGRRIASLVTSESENYEYGASGYAERYSTNPAEIVLDYLRNPRYGKGLKNSEIHWDSFRKAAAKCNQEVEYVAGIKGPILTTNYVLDTAQTIFNNTKTLISNMRGYLPYVQGKYKLKIEDAGSETDILSGVATIVSTFTKDNIVGDITYTGIDRNSKYNQVVVSYVDPDQKWSVQQVVYPETEAERLSFISKDGNRENKNETTFPGLTNYAIAKDMAKMIFNKSRWQDTCSFTADSSAMELEPGDNIYIASNILNFGTDPNNGAVPWRIVSIKLNNNYTFDIGCVRNPDFIYPHARVGEIDVVLPTYVPKGATIYYPGNVRTPPVGLVPPTNGIINPGGPGGPSYPDQTDPGGSTGGGVGGIGGVINIGGPNNPPTNPPPIKPLNDVVTINKASYSVEGNIVYATLEFVQPDHPMYTSLMIWFKRGATSETVWKVVEVMDKPGANQVVSVKLGPLIKDIYDIRTRVKYNTGEFSTIVGRSQINATGVITTENPPDFAETVGSGWTINTTPIENQYDTYINKIVGQTLLTAGAPRSPRRLQVAITQEIFVNPINGYVTGINIYYKPSANKFWKTATYTFPATYVEGAVETFELPFGLGPSGSLQFYDFCFRYKYRDGLESKLQYRVMGARVQTDPFSAVSFDPFYYVSPANAGRESVNDFTLITEQNAPPGSVTNTKEMKLTFKAISNSLSTNKIYFNLDTPSAENRSSLYGAKVYYKKVLNTSTSTENVSVTPLGQDATGYFVEVTIDYDTIYEYVIVPLVDFDGASTEGDNAVYFSGALHNRTTDADYPSNGNWLSFFTAFNGTTTACLALIGTAKPAGIRKNTRFSAISGQTLLTSGAPRTPRAMNVTVTQDIVNGGLNSAIKGFKIYYKSSAATYWNSFVHTASGYTQGSAYTFAFSGLGAPGTNDSYDMAFRFVYSDDTESALQTRYVAVQVETDALGGLSFNPFAAASPINENADAFDLVTVENAPPGAVVDPRDTQIGFNFIGKKSTGTGIVFNVKPPDASNISDWLGVRIWQKKVLPTSTSITTVDVTPVPQPTTGVYAFELTIDFDTVYEWVIVPLVLYSSATTEANQAWYVTGQIHGRTADADYPVDGNWLQKLTLSLAAKATSYAKIGTALPAGPNRATKFEHVKINELKTAGNPRDPRQIEVKILQSSTTLGNGRLKGVKVYYKPSLFGFWSSSSHTFSGYTQGSEYTYTFAGDIGSPVTLTTGDRAANYDFLVRFTYDDGSEGVYQCRGQELPVQGGASNPYSLQFVNIGSDTFPFTTVENAPPGSVVDPRETILTFNTTNGMASNREEAILFYPNAPVDPLNQFLGVRLYFREVVPGANPAFQVINFLPISRDASGNLLFKQLVTYGKKYEFVIVPVVSYNRVKTEGNYAWYGRGAIDGKLTVIGTTPNWWQILGFELLDTSLALGRIKTVFAQAAATVQVMSWSRIQTNINNPTNQTSYYYQLKFYHQHIANYNDLYIYRRSYFSYGANSQFAKYYGLGRWERMIVTTVNNATNGTVTVNLRSPISFQEYNPYFTGFPETAANTLLSGVYVTNKPLGGTGGVEEFLIVARSNSTLSTDALLLPPISASTGVALVNGLTNGRVTTVAVSDYNGLDADFERNLSEFRTNVSAGNIRMLNPSAIGYTGPAASPSVI